MIGKGTMKLKKKSDLIRNVAENWKRQYWHPKRGWQPHNESKEVIYRELSELPEQATEDDIAAIIGNAGWTRNKCDECGQDVDVTVMVGQEPDYESRTAFICLDCLKRAVTLIELEAGKLKGDNGRSN